MGSEQSISDIAHRAEPGNVQETFICRFLLVGQSKRRFPLRKRAVIVLRRLPHFVILRSVQLRNCFCVACNRARLVHRVPVVAQARIQQQGHSCKKQQNEKGGCPVVVLFLHAGFSLPLRAGGMLPPAAIGKKSKISCALSCACGSPAPQPRPAQGPSRGCRTPSCPCRR